MFTNGLALDELFSFFCCSDKGTGDHGREHVDFCGASATFTSENTTLGVGISEHGCARYIAQEYGGLSDNPTHATSLTDEQKHHIVSAMYTDVSSFTVVFGANDSPSVHSRNFFFSSIAALCGNYLFFFLHAGHIFVEHVHNPVSLSCFIFFFRSTNSHTRANTRTNI